MNNKRDAKPRGAPHRNEPITEFVPINLYATKPQKDALYWALDVVLQQRGDDAGERTQQDKDVSNLIRVIMDGLK